MTLDAFQIAADDEVQRQVMRLNRELTRHFREARDQIQGELERLYARVLDGVDPKDYYAVAVKRNRLTKLQSEVQTAYTTAARRAGQRVREAASLSMANGYYYNQYALTAASGTAGIKIGFAALPERLIELAVTGQVEVFKSIRANVIERFGSLENYVPQRGTLSDLLMKRRTVDLRRVQDAVTQSLIQGKSVGRATRDVTRAVAISRNNAERIIRTETHRTLMLSNFAATNHAKAEGANTRRRILSVLDDRTRPQSAQVDGIFEDENGQFAYPGGLMVTVPGATGIPEIDINDRERVVNVVEGFPAESRRARDPVTGKNETISFARFDAWARDKGLTRNRYGQMMPT